MSEQYIATLSVQDPWCRYILYFDKDVENRTWRTPYRGPLLIHCGKKRDTSCAIPRTLDRFPPAPGCIVGIVELVDIVVGSRSPWAQPGQCHWMLSNPRAFPEPIPYRGQLGLFYVPLALLPPSARALL
jgi:hypothetical protein